MTTPSSHLIVISPRVRTYRGRSLETDSRFSVRLSESSPDKSERIVVPSPHDRAVRQLLLARGAAADAGLDEGLPSFTPPIFFYTENPYICSTFQ